MEISSSNPSERGKKVRALEKRDSSSSGDDGSCFAMSAFSVPSSDLKPSNVVPLDSAGICLYPIIDSGSDVNLLDPGSWKRLVDAGCVFEPAKIDANIFLYGRRHRLHFERAIKIRVQSRSRSVLAKFHVFRQDGGDYQPIMGEMLVKKLKVLRIGDRVNALYQLPKRTSSQLGKLHGFRLSVPLDPSVSSVAQSCRCVPFVKRKKLLAHTEELLQDDVIERVTGAKR